MDGDLASAYRLCPLQDLVPNFRLLAQRTDWILKRKTKCPGGINRKLENGRGIPGHLGRQTGKIRQMSEAESGGKDDSIFRLQIYIRYKCLNTKIRKTIK